MAGIKPPSTARALFTFDTLKFRNTAWTRFVVFILACGSFAIGATSLTTYLATYSALKKINLEIAQSEVKFFATNLNQDLSQMVQNLRAFAEDERVLKNLSAPSPNAHFLRRLLDEFDDLPGFVGIQIQDEKGTALHSHTINNHLDPSAALQIFDRIETMPPEFEDGGGQNLFFDGHDLIVFAFPILVEAENTYYVFGLFDLSGFLSRMHADGLVSAAVFEIGHIPAHDERIHYLVEFPLILDRFNLVSIWDLAGLDTKHEGLVWRGTLAVIIAIFVTCIFALFIGYWLLARPMTLLQNAKKALESDLREIEFKSKIADIVSEGILVLDPKGRTLWCNPAIEKMFGYSLADLQGRRPGDLVFGEETDTETIMRLNQARKDVRSIEVELLLLHRSGSTVWVTAATSHILDEAGQVEKTIYVCRDISDERAQRIELETALTEAEHATATKSRFLANMSHEIRTPMNGILGMTTALLESDMTADQRDMLGVVSRSSGALLAIINDILDISKIEAEKMELHTERFNLEEEIYDIAGLLKRGNAKQAVKIIIDYRDATPEEIIADSKRIRQILLNLMGNAYKFTDEGHVLVTVNSTTRGGCPTLQITVSDTGIGIPKDMQDNIFDAFEQVSTGETRRFEGTGLGLAITSKLVQAMDGHIDLTSTHGVGSSFRITIPYESTDARDAITVSQKGRVALWCRDNNLRAIFAHRLVKAGLRIVLESSTLDALDEGTFFTSDADLLVIADSAHHIPPAEIEAHAKRIVLISRNAKIISEPYVPVIDPLLPTAGFVAALDSCLTGKPVKQTKPKTAQIAPKKQSGAESIHLLVAEDNKTNQLVLRKFLANSDYALDIYPNGAEALAAFEAAPAKYRAVLMDISMPVMGGVEATEHIRAFEAKEDLAETPIIALTANALKEDGERYEAVGMNAFIPKPISKADLLKTLEKLTRTHVS